MTNIFYCIKWTLCYVFCLLLTINVQAQFTPQERFEMPVTQKRISEDFMVTSLKQKGVLFLAIREKWNDKQMSWELIRMDTTMRQVWKKGEKFDKFFSPIHAYYDQYKFVYFLMTREEKKQFKIVKLNIKNGTTEVFDGTLPLKVELKKVRVAGNYAFFTGTFNSDIAALRFNMLDGTTKIVPATYSKTYNSLDVYSHPTINSGFYLMRNTRNCNTQVHTISNIVGLQPGKTVELPRRYTLHSAHVYPLSATKSLLLGTYSIKCQPYPQGLATMLIKSGRQSRLRLHKFLDFRNFLNFYSEKKIKRIRRRALKKEAQGKEYTLRSKMLLGNIVEFENKDNLLVIAERYWYHNRVVSSSIRRPSALPRVITQGQFQFTSASISAINHNGKRLWDNTIKIKPSITTLNLKPQIRVGFKGDSVILAYMRQYRESSVPVLWSKLIHKNKTIKKETEDEVVNPNPDDRIYSATNQHFIHWYGDVFLLWGKQVVFDRKAAGIGIRKEVAFINKLRYNHKKLTKKDLKKLKKQKRKKKGKTKSESSLNKRE